MDAKFNILKRAVAEDKGDEDFTAKNYVMARVFYKAARRSRRRMHRMYEYQVTLARSIYSSAARPAGEP